MRPEIHLKLQNNSTFRSSLNHLEASKDIIAALIESNSFTSTKTYPQIFNDKYAHTNWDTLSCTLNVIRPSYGQTHYSPLTNWKKKQIISWHYCCIQPKKILEYAASGNTIYQIADTLQLTPELVEYIINNK